ncbi:UDP-N-acetylmuramoyl-L-alanine--D-glutamate ligase [Oceanidesulfovibrio indonesiensis]|uniref:UDP-N-acetylmuramoylalanine--D-glutamate ligase n=1 Tax=Oceanidesulfovibrio indonesiensis TaxID=54767 RepID=A0A7M3MIY5_9BACT|nr:UDP-N-acetylmuramoyl-L-alanine--D-glutamate ligase [Oceanidesulfovibrio indonesiensis]TVM19777.1 UDP-N-acetylmuramoyl-L-alanine--D-glutamate ligase [Oceanidesulfovibrio indonesiensis]
MRGTKITSTPLAGSRAGVLGSGRSGRAAALVLKALGASVRVVDKDAERLAAVYAGTEEERTFELVGGEHGPSQFAGLDLLVVSPGARVRDIEPHLPAGLHVIAELELASRMVQEPIVAITGTNGKTTTASLVDAMLRSAGRKVFLGGNIGTPLAEYLLTEDRADVLVLEVSSFQLQHCETFRPRVGVLLNFSPDHLDYHASLEEYLEAKLKLFENQTAEDVALIDAALRGEIERRGPLPARVEWLTRDIDFDTPHLLGAHNRQNTEAAWKAVRAVGVSEKDARAAAYDFEPPPHRLQIVAEKRGIRFIDDSKATTVESLAAALQAMDRPVRLLAGGKYKGGDLEALRPLISEKVRAVGLYGGSREVFEKAWAGAAKMFWEETMEAAFAAHMDEAQEGEIVLLSPATSSFDQYANYIERGNDFRRLVEDA